MTKQIEKECSTATENIMGTMEINRLLVAISLPMIISMLVSSLFNLIDSIFIAQLSENALAAVSLAYPIQSLMTAFGAGWGVGINALLSESLGAKDYERVNRVVGNGIFLGTLSAMVFCGFGIFFAKTYFYSQTDVAEVIGYGNDYLSICCIGSIGLFYEFTFNKFLQATGRTKYMLFEQAIVVSIKLLLDPVLIFGLVGMPALGVVGAALTTVIGQGVGAGTSFFLNMYRNTDIEFSLKYIRPKRPIIRDICYIGVPSAMMLSVGSIMSYGMNKILISFNTTATALFGIYFKIQSFVMMPVQGLNNAIVPIVSYNTGARKYNRIQKIVNCSIFYAMGITMLGTFVVWIFTDELLGLFNASEVMLEIGRPALRIISLNFLFAGFNGIISSVCQALRHSISSLAISLIRQVIVLLPAAVLFAKVGGLTAVWWAFIVAEALGSCVSCALLRKMMKDMKLSRN